MSSPQFLENLMIAVRNLEKKLSGSDSVNIEIARGCYQAFLDKFYLEYRHMMAPQQYVAAKNDSKYFLRLIELACFHELDKNGMGENDVRKLDS